MDRLVAYFQDAHLHGSGPRLAATLVPNPPPDDPAFLERICRFSDSLNVVRDITNKMLATAPPKTFSKAETNAWAEVYAAYWKAVGILLQVQAGDGRRLPDLYEAWKEMVLTLIKGYSNGHFQSWTVPCLYVVGRYLRTFAISADEKSHEKSRLAFNPDIKEDIVSDGDKNDKLEDAARVINRIFTLCISDRSPIEESRKWAIYYTTNLLFKTYFKLNSVSLSKNILRALQASQSDIPPIENFPKSHIVTFKYYVGLICFLEENYELAEENLTYAYTHCHQQAQRNKELILTYLIPTRLLTSHKLPSTRLLSAYPTLRRYFERLAHCIRQGDLAGFDAALAANEDAFVQRRIYLTLERGRDVALRNLLRKVYIAGGFEESKDGGPPLRRTRVPVAEFAAAIRLGTRQGRAELDGDEVECMMANMIYKNLMKGYIARERGIVVLSKGSAFPGTGV